LLKVETGFLDNDGHFDEFVNPRFAGWPLGTIYGRTPIALNIARGNADASWKPLSLGSVLFVLMVYAHVMDVPSFAPRGVLRHYGLPVWKVCMLELAPMCTQLAHQCEHMPSYMNNACKFWSV
jgi:hypothetical protein